MKRIILQPSRVNLVNKYEGVIDSKGIPKEYPITVVIPEGTLSIRSAYVSGLYEGLVRSSGSVETALSWMTLVLPEGLELPYVTIEGLVRKSLKYLEW